MDSGEVRTPWPWTHPQEEYTQIVRFSKSFTKIPKVVVGINELDTPHKRNLRVTVEVSSSGYPLTN